MKKNLSLKILVLIFIFSFINNVNAQLVQTILPYVGDITSSVISATNIFAETDGEVDFFSINNGTCWTLINIPITIADNSGGTAQLYSRLVTSATNGINTSLREAEFPPTLVYPHVCSNFQIRYVNQSVMDTNISRQQLNAQKDSSRMVVQPRRSITKLGKSRRKCTVHEKEMPYLYEKNKYQIDSLKGIKLHPGEGGGIPKRDTSNPKRNTEPGSKTKLIKRNK